MSHGVAYRGSQLTADRSTAKPDDKTKRGTMGKDSSAIFGEPKERYNVSPAKGVRVSRFRNGHESRRQRDDIVNDFSDTLIRDEPLLVEKQRKVEKKRRKSNEDFEDLEAMRNGAINRSLEKGLLHRRKKNGEHDYVKGQFTLDPRKKIPEKYTYRTGKGNTGEADELLLFSKDKTPQTKVTSKPKKPMTRKQLDSVSSFDFQHLKPKSPDGYRAKDGNKKRIRPKSAGQAMFMRVNCLSSESDDSSLDGEIEVIDLDDSLQFSDDVSAMPVSVLMEDRYRGTVDNAVTVHANDDVGNFKRSNGRQFDSRGHDVTSGLVKTTDENDVSDPFVKRSRKFLTTEPRRRIKSETDVPGPAGELFVKPNKSQSVKIKRGLNSKSSYQILEHQENKPKITQQKSSIVSDVGSRKPKFGKEKLYADAFEKVLSKYSKFTIARDGSTQPVQAEVPDKRAGARAARANVPRKLKPILKREKLSPISQNKSGERDFQIPSH